MHHGRSTTNTSVVPASSDELQAPTEGKSTHCPLADKENLAEGEETLSPGESCNGVTLEPQVSKEEVFKPRQPSRWQLKLFCLYISFILLGFATGTLGPTLVDLEELYQIDTSTLSVVFTAGGLGYLGGSLLCGFVYDFFNYEAQFTIAMLILGATTAAMPWPDRYAGYVSLNAMEQAAGGFMDAGGQAYLLYQVKGHRFQDAFMQGSQAAWSVGITIVPLVIQPFLRDVSTTLNSTEVANLNHTAMVLLSNDTTPANQYLYGGTPIAQNNLSDLFSTEPPCWTCNNTGPQVPETRIRYGHLLVGCIIIVLSFPFCVVFFLEPKFCLQRTRHKKQPHSAPSKSGVRRSYFVTSLVILFLWFFSQCWVETTMGNFVATFAVKRLGWTRKAGAWITSALWGSELAGRLLAVPLAACLSPRTMVYGSVVGTVVGCGITLALATVHDAFFWLGIVVGGLANSPGFGATILWAADYIPVTGVAASVFLVGASAGSTVGPLLAGLLFDTYGPMCILYVCFAGSVLQIGATIAYELVVRNCRRMALREGDGTPAGEEEKLKETEA